jgi:2-dehydro-3-deoxygluconokinase
MVVIGECMLELTRDGDHWQLGYAGDTFNTAVYLIRLGVPAAYLTALGSDSFSAEMRAAWVAEGLDTSLVLTDPSRLPGLYAVRNDAAGERHFCYWRERSAVRQLFALPGIEAAVACARASQELYLSGITLSLFRQTDRAKLNEIAVAVRAARGRVIFDTNYRANGWSSAEEARTAIWTLAPAVNIALPTFSDDAALFGDASPADTIRRWHDWGAQLVIVKLGPQGCLVSEAGVTTEVPAITVPRVIDTTGAGDAFNAGFLAARRAGQDPLRAVRAGHELASRVIQHKGAILPRERTGELRSALGLN